MDKLKQALLKLFDTHRIVFWYDSKNELRDEYENLDLPGIEKLEPKKNQFHLKYRMLRRHPQQKYLLYHAHGQPEDLDNWLLDVQLAQGEFRTDQVSIHLSQLELGPEFRDTVESHGWFFNAAKRRDALKKHLEPRDTPGMLRLKMLAVCANAYPNLEEILENLLDELAQQKQDRDGEKAEDKEPPRFSLVQRSRLEEYLWEQLKRRYQYRSPKPGVEDFVIQLFKSAFAMGAPEASSEAAQLNGDAVVFLRKWKNNRRCRDAFAILSQYVEDILDIRGRLCRRDYRPLLEIDYFRCIEPTILEHLVREVEAGTLSAGQCRQLLHQRRQSFFYEDYRHYYQAVDYAAQFLHALKTADLSVQSMAQGIRGYTENWQWLDFFYRKCIHHTRRSRNPALLDALTTQVENHYIDNFLLKVNDNWQQVVDRAETWEVPGVMLQNRFFQRRVLPFCRDKKKVWVIISDGLRYEAGRQLQGEIRRQWGFEADLTAQLTLLPSYTQLGMAALLPHKELEPRGDGDGNILVDEQRSGGLDYRRKILQKALPGEATAIDAEELEYYSTDQCRQLGRENRVIYVYHNGIDSIGDKRDSEVKVFEEVEKTIRLLSKLVKKLISSGASNLLITSDHGFLYQQRPVSENDYIQLPATKEKETYYNRRFRLGRNLTPHPGLKHYHARQMGLAGNMEIQVPKSINRLRQKGAGSRYVHGGASLQETITPVLHIRKKSRDTVAFVDVDIIRAGNALITAGQLSVAFFQEQPVSDNRQPRTLHAGIYTQEGQLISDSHKLLFNFADSDSRLREMNVRFILTRDANHHNNKEVFLRLTETHHDTSHEKIYKSSGYMLRRSFLSDFE